MADKIGFRTGLPDAVGIHIRNKRGVILAMPKSMLVAIDDFKCVRFFS